MNSSSRLEGTVKSSALIGREGVGAIVEEGSLSYVISPIDKWIRKGAEVAFPTPSRVLTLLGKSELRRFSFALDESERKRTQGMVPTAVRFPRALLCMSCDRLYVGGIDSQETDCRRCRGKGRQSKLFGANWVMVCHRGHLDDVWWGGLAHRDELKTATGSRANCKSDQQLYLKPRGKGRKNQTVTKDDGSSSSAATNATPKGRNMYTNQVVWCEECGASSDLSSLRSAATSMRVCRSLDPWGMDTNSTRANPHCSWAILRSSTQILQTNGASFLDIDRSDGIDQSPSQEVTVLPIWFEEVINDAFANGFRDQVRLSADPQEKIRLAERFADSLLKRIAWKDSQPPKSDLALWMLDQFQQSAVEDLGAAAVKTQGPTNYLAESDYDSRMDEWKVLSEGSVRRTALHIEKRDAPIEVGVGALSAVGRFREIRVPLGYSRVHLTRPDSAHHSCKNPSGCDETPQRRGVADENVNWLPAHEVFGEGIYIGLDPALVDRVVNSAGYREKHALGGAGLAEHPLLHNRLDLKILLAPAFPIVHTLSHLLIKELAFIAGYSLPSLRERIFVDESQSKAGLLIYTADGDSEGSLGGLVRLANGTLISQLVNRLIVRNSWCPQDPICWESSQSGALGLNRSSCHGCTIIPETSCAHSNLRLDRHSIVDNVGGMQRWLKILGGRNG
jgi:hypothetical protein